MIERQGREWRESRAAGKAAGVGAMVTEAPGELLSRSRMEAAASVRSGSSGQAGSVQGAEEGDGRGARGRGEEDG